MAGRLDGKAALVTGGARGLGLAQATLFCEEGACVTIADVLEEEGEAAAAGLVARGFDARFSRLDVSSEKDWRGAVEGAVTAYGQLTTLVNNAGIYLAAGLEDEDAEVAARLISIDQTGVYHGMRAAMPALVASGHGAIVNISSVLGLLGTLRCFSYHAAKGAVRAMSRAAAAEYGPKNVRINSIYPGSVEAPSHQGSPGPDSALVMSRTPMGRKGEPRDVAYASLFLCSDEARFITGAELTVDGGMCCS